MRSIQDIKNDLAEAIAKCDAWEIDADDPQVIALYDDMLDDSGPVNIAGLDYDVSHALKQVDPTAYRCGLLDYIDGLDERDFAEYQELMEAVETLESELEGAQEGADQ